MSRDDARPTLPAPAGDLPTDPVVIGRIGAPHGVRGDVLITSFTDPIDNLLDYAPRFMREVPGGSAREQRSQRRWQRLELQSLRPYRDRFLARVPGYEQREAVALLRGREIAVDRSSLPMPAPDEHYWRDLNGARVINRAGDELGRVRAMMETGAHTVLVVRHEDGERLIPFVDDYVDSVGPDESSAVSDAAGRLLLQVDWQREWDE